MLFNRLYKTINLKFIVLCFFIFLIVSLNFYLLNKVMKNTQPAFMIEKSIQI